VTHNRLPHVDEAIETTNACCRAQCIVISFSLSIDIRSDTQSTPPSHGLPVIPPATDFFVASCLLQAQSLFLLHRLQTCRRHVGIQNLGCTASWDGCSCDEFGITQTHGTRNGAKKGASAVDNELNCAERTPIVTEFLAVDKAWTRFGIDADSKFTA
jgi:hypothetical protein